ncbi:MAG: iron-containing alcohol dehydrogenase [Candidatus Poribacteria bacterium]|nr:iron-containing alcohol dehydrogenase [Candidatus Poribacteria bacterium]
MLSFDFQPSTRVVFGENALGNLGSLAKELGAQDVLIITDPGVAEAGIVEKAVDFLVKQSISCAVFQEVEENPTTKHVANGVRFARDLGQLDLIVGLGGGSAMDCAKGMNFILTNGGVMEDFWGMDKASKPMLPSIGIPTTAGTGSEAQSYALIAREESHVKMACGDKKARFRTVILDPVLTSSAPDDVRASTGIDAISHAVESHVATRRNPVSQLFSREAWCLLENSFETVIVNPANLEAQSQMLLGAHYAGVAVENSMLGAAHACANPLTSSYGITHGVAVGLMLPHVIKFNSRIMGKSYRELHSSSIYERVCELKAAAHLPGMLRDFGIDESDLPRLAGEAANQWTGKFNPRPANETELLQLYESAY